MLDLLRFSRALRRHASTCALNVERVSAFLPSGVEEARRAGRHHAPPPGVWPSPSECRVSRRGRRRRRAMPVERHAPFTLNISFHFFFTSSIYTYIVPLNNYILNYTLTFLNYVYVFYKCI